MRLFDEEKIGCYLDTFTPRVEITKDGDEHKLLDLTLRVQPITPALAVSIDPEIRVILFSLLDGSPKPKIKAVTFNHHVPKQMVEVFTLPEDEAPMMAFFDVEIDAPRARSEKGVDGFAFIFYATVGPLGRDETEYIREWHTHQRFLTFNAQQRSLL